MEILYIFAVEKDSLIRESIKGERMKPHKTRLLSQDEIKEAKARAEHTQSLKDVRKCDKCSNEVLYFNDTMAICKDHNVFGQKMDGGIPEPSDLPAQERDNLDDIKICDYGACRDIATLRSFGENWCHEHYMIMLEAQMTPNEKSIELDRTIEVTSMAEQPDGSAIVTFEMGSEAIRLFVQKGMTTILEEMIKNE